MKTIKIPDKIHAKLTSVLGQLIAESAKTKTYADAIEAMLDRSVILPPDLAEATQGFITENKQLGYSNKDELVKDVLRQALIDRKRKVSN